MQSLVWGRVGLLSLLRVTHDPTDNKPPNLGDEQCLKGIHVLNTLVENAPKDIADSIRRCSETSNEIGELLSERLDDCNRLLTTAVKNADDRGSIIKPELPHLSLLGIFVVAKLLHHTSSVARHHEAATVKLDVESCPCELKISSIRKDDRSPRQHRH